MQEREAGTPVLGAGAPKCLSFSLSVGIKPLYGLTVSLLFWNEPGYRLVLQQQKEIYFTWTQNK